MIVGRGLAPASVPIYFEMLYFWVQYRKLYPLEWFYYVRYLRREQAPALQYHRTANYNLSLECEQLYFAPKN